MAKTTRPISWLNATRKGFEDFPEGVRANCVTALTIAAEGSKTDSANPRAATPHIASAAVVRQNTSYHR